MYPDYNNCLVNVSNSILKHYGAKPAHGSLPQLDKYLEKDYKNVIILLYDAFGSNLIKRHLSEYSFLNKNKIKDITSVFPATTVAATTSIMSGLTPAQHCWLGWDNYIKSIDKIITMYKSVEKGVDTKIADSSLCKKEFPYITIFDKINETENAKAYCISPHEGILYNTDNLQEIYDKIAELCNTDEKKFIYAYCEEPDHSMHEYGTEDEKVIKIMQFLDKKTEELSSKLQDTLLIVTADHGHITVGDYIVLDDYPHLKDMLVRETSLEPRATNFFVKEDMLQEFQKEFNKLFRNDFILLSKQEVLEKQLFGDGTPNEKFDSCLGDFVSLAISNKAFRDTYNAKFQKGLHAGITEDEVLVPLIVVET